MEKIPSIKRKMKIESKIKGDVGSYQPLFQ